MNYENPNIVPTFIGLEANRMAGIITAEIRDLMDELINVAGSHGFCLVQPKRSGALQESIAKLIQLAINREIHKQAGAIALAQVDAPEGSAADRLAWLQALPDSPGCCGLAECTTTRPGCSVCNEALKRAMADLEKFEEIDQIKDRLHQAYPKPMAQTNESQPGAPTLPEHEHFEGMNECAVCDVFAHAQAQSDIKIFKLNDCDWVAARDLNEAIEFYLGKVGTPPKAATPETRAAELAEYIDEPYQESAESMGRLMITDEDNPAIKRTFAEELGRMIAAGQRFPVMFCSTEY